MKIVCPACSSANILNDDDVAADSFSIMCDRCNQLLSVTIRVQAMNVLRTGKKQEAPQETKVAQYIYEHANELRLPVLPVLAMKIRKIKNDPDGSINDVVELVKTDQIIAGKILELANSALYGGLMEITVLKRAIMRLGLTVCETLVNALENRRLYESDNKAVLDLLQMFWLHALGVAVCSQKIAEIIKFPDVEEVFSAGLLHDFGYILVIQALQQNKNFNMDFNKLSKEEFFSICFEDHAKLGAWYLKEKGIPDTLTTIVENHEDIPTDQSENQALHIVALANQLCKKVGLGPKHEPDLRLEITESSQFLDLTEIQLADLEVNCEDMVNQLALLLG